MWRASLVCWLLVSGATTAAANEVFPPRLSPSGMKGGVIMVSKGAVGMDAVEPFMALAGAQNNSVVLLTAAGDDVSPLSEQLKKANANPTTLIVENASVDAFALLVSRAAGCWLIDPNIAKDVRLNKHLQAARERGAVIVGRPADVLALCPDLALVKGDQSSLPGKIGVEIADGALFIVHQRMLFNHGAGEVKLHLAKSPSREPRTITLSRASGVDYNELRRAAWGRTQAAYPPTKIGEPRVAKGALVIVGGGGMPKEIADRLFELGGGAEGKFVVLPTAMPDPLPAGNEGAFLERLGAKHVTVIKAREQDELETAENLAALDSATAIWFGGGRQWRFVDAYEGTKVYDKLHAVLARGGVIGGSSAGATIQGEYLVRGAPAGPHIMMCEGYERGFNFLPGVAIDQHFKQRNRFADMTGLMKVYPQYLGIGLDEATAIVVQGHTAEVLGRGEVHFYNRRAEPAEGQPDYESIGDGKKYDLLERKMIE